MKKSFAKHAAEKGGLMIEALAMLGLIAVVTPTMYKKSAERALEVEDINTADTVRSYMSATEAYMAANYRNIMKDMVGEDGKGTETEKTVSWNDIKPYMPYGFENGKALYDYGEPKIAIRRQGDNLTAFALFPAKSAGGLGQERTTRIASLVGSNGGYIKSDKSAHGVGGVWNLDTSDVQKIFGEGDNNEFSLVTASSNVINSISGAGVLENTKYLQRTAENTGEKWRNAMRTDLYMGGAESDASGDPDDKNVVLHNIRNINSLIVGAAEDENTESKNGLYIKKGGDNPNAYIGGTLTAAEDMLFADKDKLGYGGVPVKDKDGNVTGTDYNFEVTKGGDVYSRGGELDLASGMALQDGSVSIGKFGDGDNHLIYGRNTSANGAEASMYLLSPDIFALRTSGDAINAAKIDSSYGKYYTEVLVRKNGFKGADRVEGKDSGGNNIGPKYTKDQTFPVVTGSNMMVEGVLAAGQIDTQHLRTASFSSGSEHIDDQYKWLKVDKDGIVIDDPNVRAGYGVQGTHANINVDTVAFKIGDGDTNPQNADNSLISMERDGTGQTVTVRNNHIGTQIKGTDMTIGNRSGDDITAGDSSSPQYRVVYGHGGDVDVVGSNFKVVGADDKNILTVRGNANNEPTGGYNDYKVSTYNSGDSQATNYNVMTHGDVLFSSKSDKKATELDARADGTADGAAHFLAIGPNDASAGVDIAESSEGRSSLSKARTNNNQRVLFVDLSKKDDNAHVDTGTDNYKLVNGNSTVPENREMQAGTVYVRKGLVEVTPDRDTAKAGTAANSTLRAEDGSGIVRASRFVANNVDADGKLVAPDQIYADTVYAKYGEDVGKRYDRYMVNPAYTSVMKDIKLTTRGGARLSDILPDFINKGIYLATNTYDDDLPNMEIKLENDSGLSVSVGGHDPHESAVTGAENKNNWASPFSGMVPAPQCPPGYSRVITVNPYAFAMAQAGNLRNGKEQRASGADDSSDIGYYVDSLGPSGDEGMVGNAHRLESNLDDSALAKRSPQYRQVTLKSGTSLPVSGLPSASGGTVSADLTTTADASLSLGHSGEASGSSTYVLSAEGTDSDKPFTPLTFQQSTFLVTEAVPVCTGLSGRASTSKYGRNCSGSDVYTRGWAVLQGFLYHTGEYSALTSNNFGKKYDAYDSSGNSLGGTEDVVWNLFPVAKNSLASYVNTYCYFDRGNLVRGADGIESTKEVEHFDIMTQIPTGFKKGEGLSNVNEYYKQLNDPTMKYDEKW